MDLSNNDIGHAGWLEEQGLGRRTPGRKGGQVAAKKTLISMVLLGQGKMLKEDLKKSCPLKENGSRNY